MKLRFLKGPKRRKDKATSAELVMTCALGEVGPLQNDDEESDDGAPDPNDIVVHREQVHDELDLAQEMEMDRQLWMKTCGQILYHV